MATTVAPAAAGANALLPHLHSNAASPSHRQRMHNHNQHHNQQHHHQQQQQQRSASSASKSPSSNASSYAPGAARFQSTAASSSASGTTGRPSSAHPPPSPPSSSSSNPITSVPDPHQHHHHHHSSHAPHAPHPSASPSAPPAPAGPKPTDVVYLNMRGMRFRVNSQILALLPDSMLMTLFPSGLIAFYPGHDLAAATKEAGEDALGDVVAEEEEEEEGEEEDSAAVEEVASGLRVPAMGREASCDPRRAAGRIAGGFLSNGILDEESMEESDLESIDFNDETDEEDEDDPTQYDPTNSAEDPLANTAGGLGKPPLPPGAVAARPVPRTPTIPTSTPPRHTATPPTPDSSPIASVPRPRTPSTSSTTSSRRAALAWSPSPTPPNPAVTAAPTPTPFPTPPTTSTFAGEFLDRVDDYKFVEVDFDPALFHYVLLTLEKVRNGTFQEEVQASRLAAAAAGGLEGVEETSEEGAAAAAEPATEPVEHSGEAETSLPAASGAASSDNEAEALTPKTPGLWKSLIDITDMLGLSAPFNKDAAAAGTGKPSSAAASTPTTPPSAPVTPTRRARSPPPPPPRLESIVFLREELEYFVMGPFVPPMASTPTASPVGHPITQIEGAVAEESEGGMDDAVAEKTVEQAVGEEVAVAVPVIERETPVEAGPDAVTQIAAPADPVAPASPVAKDEEGFADVVAVVDTGALDRASPSPPLRLRWKRRKGSEAIEETGATAAGANTTTGWLGKIVKKVAKMVRREPRKEKKAVGSTETTYTPSPFSKASSMSTVTSVEAGVGEGKRSVGDEKEGVEDGRVEGAARTADDEAAVLHVEEEGVNGTSASATPTVNGGDGPRRLSVQVEEVNGGDGPRRLSVQVEEDPKHADPCAAAPDEDVEHISSTPDDDAAGSPPSLAPVPSTASTSTAQAARMGGRSSSNGGWWGAFTRRRASAVGSLDPEAASAMKRIKLRSQCCRYLLARELVAPAYGMSGCALSLMPVEEEEEVEEEVEPGTAAPAETVDDGVGEKPADAAALSATTSAVTTAGDSDSDAAAESLLAAVSDSKRSRRSQSRLSTTSAASKLSDASKSSSSSSDTDGSFSAELRDAAADAMASNLVAPKPEAPEANVTTTGEEPAPPTSAVEKTPTRSTTVSSVVTSSSSSSSSSLSSYDSDLDRTAAAGAGARTTDAGERRSGAGTDGSRNASETPLQREHLVSGLELFADIDAMRTVWGHRVADVGGKKILSVAVLPGRDPRVAMLAAAAAAAASAGGGAESPSLRWTAANGTEGASGGATLAHAVPGLIQHLSAKLPVRKVWWEVVEGYLDPMGNFRPFNGDDGSAAVGDYGAADGHYGTTHRWPSLFGNSAAGTAHAGGSAGGIELFRSASHRMFRSRSGSRTSWTQRGVGTGHPASEEKEEPAPQQQQRGFGRRVSLPALSGTSSASSVTSSSSVPGALDAEIPDDVPLPSGNGVTWLPALTRAPSRNTAGSGQAARGKHGAGAGGAANVGAGSVGGWRWSLGAWSASERSPSAGGGYLDKRSATASSLTDEGPAPGQSWARPVVKLWIRRVWLAEFVSM
ncbi:hypothetical protein HDU96_005969 [Phlyctochytrium bullatum]|nr:hypothetical protein HDU96_005969 [Phlyctochytrium bullatum]